MKQNISLIFFIFIINSLKSSEDLSTQITKVISTATNNFVTVQSQAQKQLTTELTTKIIEFGKSPEMTNLITSSKDSLQNIISNAQLQIIKQVSISNQLKLMNLFSSLILTGGCLQIFEGCRQGILICKNKFDSNRLRAFIILVASGITSFFLSDNIQKKSIWLGALVVLIGLSNLWIEDLYLSDMKDNILQKILWISGITNILTGTYIFYSQKVG